MEIHPTISGARKALVSARADGSSIGFVPTMGALHAGHLSLIERARKECDVVVVSIFVNPLQFGAHEDLSHYPRPFEQDVQLASDAGADHLFNPSEEEMYPNGPIHTSIHVSGLTGTLEGAHRPGHFDGVATVVAKLFGIVGACRAYFGEKDWQQLAVVRRMTADLLLPIEIVGCPTVRDPDGLAMSSRNVYLDQDHRQAALALHRCLQMGAAAIAAGERNGESIATTMRSVLSEQTLVAIDYATVIDDEFQVPEQISGEVRLVVAAQVGPARLIDNMGATV